MAESRVPKAGKPEVEGQAEKRGGQTRIETPVVGAKLGVPKSGVKERGKRRPEEVITEERKAGEVAMGVGRPEIGGPGAGGPGVGRPGIGRPGAGRLKAGRPGAGGLLLLPVAGEKRPEVGGPLLLPVFLLSPTLSLLVSSTSQQTFFNKRLLHSFSLFSLLFFS